jgi:uncharacterized membrane protein
VTTVVVVLTTVAAVGSALVGGVFSAFSVAVVPALRQLGAGPGTAVMREVNRVIVAAPFLVPFVGVAPVGVAAAVLGDGVPAVAGALLYAVGGFGVTVAVNVPLNNALEAEGEPRWPDYHRRWARWNHVRALACTAAAACFALALAVP